MANELSIRTTLDGSVATVTLNRPDVLNALNDVLAQALHETLKSVAADVQVRCVVINGAGANFMAGGDLQFFRERLPEIRSTQGRELRAMFEHVHGTIRVIREIPKPVIASVHGAAAGFGMSLMLALATSQWRREAACSRLLIATSVHRPTAVRPIFFRVRWA